MRRFGFHRGELLWIADPPEVKATNPALTVWRYRGRVAVPDPADDDAAFDAGDPANDTGFTMTTDTIFRIRWGVYEGASKSNTTAFGLNFQVNGGGYGAVGAATALQYADGTPTNGATCGANLLGTPTGPTGSWDPDVGKYFEDAAQSVGFTKDNWIEIEGCLYIDSAQVDDADSIQVQVTDSSGFIVSTTTTTITVDEPVVVEKAPFPRMMNRLTTVRM